LNSHINTKKFILLIAGTIAFLNILIFTLREIYPEIWWVGDQQFYVNTNFMLHLKSLCFFLFYLLILTVLSIFIFKNSNLKFIVKKNLYGFFIIISIIFIIYIYVSFYYKIGVASSTKNSAGLWQIVFYFISFDGLFFAYAIVEKNSKRLAFVSILYSISNIVRGWAGFVLNLLIIYYIRNKPKISIKKVLIVAVLILPIIILLLFSREIFRGGTGLVELYNLQNYSGIEFYVQLLNHLLVKILTRFDFYSNFIGINTLNNLGDMCFAYQENIFHKILLRIDLADQCKSLGSILPAHLSEWYLNRGTAFTVGSGFFALPFPVNIVYFYSNILVFFITTLLVRVFFNKYEIILFMLSFVYLLFLQGWIYQYIYIYLGFMMGLFIIYSSFWLNQKYELHKK